MGSSGTWGGAFTSDYPRERPFYRAPEMGDIEDGGATSFSSAILFAQRTWSGA